MFEKPDETGSARREADQLVVQESILDAEAHASSVAFDDEQYDSVDQTCATFQVADSCHLRLESMVLPDNGTFSSQNETDAEICHPNPSGSPTNPLSPFNENVRRHQDPLHTWRESFSNFTQFKENEDEGFGDFLNQYKESQELGPVKEYHQATAQPTVPPETLVVERYPAPEVREDEAVSAVADMFYHEVSGLMKSVTDQGKDLDSDHIPSDGAYFDQADRANIRPTLTCVDDKTTKTANKRKMSSDEPLDDNSPITAKWRKVETRQAVKGQDTDVLCSHPTAESPVRVHNTRGSSHSLVSPRTESMESVENTQSAEVQQTPVRILFTQDKVSFQATMVKFLKAKGCKISDGTKDEYELVVVGKSAVKKTIKLLRAIALGKTIVSEEWVRESYKSKKLLPLRNFYLADRVREYEWACTFNSHQGCTEMLLGKTVYVTPSLKDELGKDGFREMVSLARLVGAKQTISTPKAAGKAKRKDTIILASEQKDFDDDMADLRCYNRNLLPLSILRGKLDLDSDEFVAKSTLLLQ